MMRRVTCMHEREGTFYETEFREHLGVCMHLGRGSIANDLNALRIRKLTTVTKSKYNCS